MLKSSHILILLAFLIFGCDQEKQGSLSTIEVKILNQQLLDSLIIYDKEKSWEVKSTLHFKESNSVLDTMNIQESKLYQVYSFIDGTQAELGELLISPNSKIVVSIDENSPFDSSIYSGSFERSNNFFAYSKKYQNQLSEIVRKGVKQEELDVLIQEKGKLVNEKGMSLNIVDSLQTYVKEKFDQFSDILKKKNIKYVYKASLINSMGNAFSFKDINNKEIALSDFKGKYIYIDVWATWCKPCKVEHVFLKELEEHFSDNDELQIMSISIDREYDKWEKYISSKSIEGTQLYSGSNSDFVKFYDIGALPRFIFIDKAGRIISPDEIRPSNPETLKKLEKTIYNNL